MILISVLLYAVLSLCFPDSLVAHYGEIPLLALLLSQKNVTLARYGAFLSILNSSIDSHAFLGVSVLVRLLSIDISNLLLKNVYASLFVRASLATCFLSLLDWILSCLILPHLFPSLFYEIPVWDTKLVLFSLFLLFGLTCVTFLLYNIVMRNRMMKQRERV